MCETTERIRRDPVAARRLLALIQKCETLVKVIRESVEKGGGDDTSSGVGNAA